MGRREQASLWSSFKELTFCQVLLAVVFITSGLLVNLIQGVLYTTIRPYDARLYRKINYYVTYSLNCQIVFLVEWWSQSKNKLFVDPADLSRYYGKEHAMLLLNRTYEIDWVMGWLICDRVGVLGNARVYVKKILQYAPVLGWSWKFQEIVFLERDWEKDKRNLGKQLNNLVSYPDPMWLTLFPEGTRFTPAKHAANMEVARQKGLKELKHHLLPRTRGFVASMPHLREKVPALYDVVVAVDPETKTEPSMYSILKGREVSSKIMIRSWPIESVPEDDAECADWLHKRYQEKDELLDNFLKTGEFIPEGSRLSELAEFKGYREVEQPRRIWSLLIFSSWAVLILVPLMNYLWTVFTGGNFVNMALFIAAVVGANTGLMFLIDLTRISKGSSYGKQSAPNSPVAAGNNTVPSGEESVVKANGNGTILSNGNMSNGKAKQH